MNALQIVLYILTTYVLAGNVVNDSQVGYIDYLKNVLKAVENVENFRDQLKNLSFEDIREGKHNFSIDILPEDVQKSLDNAKKKEVERIRDLIKAQQELKSGHKIDTGTLQKLIRHLDGENPKKFTNSDISRLLYKAADEMRKADQEKHDRFKKHKMEQEIKRKDRLEKMDDFQRKMEEEKLKKIRSRHNKHGRMNHPGSKQQFEEVWNEQDDMRHEEFDPKVFFSMHDLNSDWHLDVKEVERIMAGEISKAYDRENPDDDNIDMEEELLRMREHFFNEVDTNGDMMVSLVFDALKILYNFC